MNTSSMERVIGFFMGRVSGFFATGRRVVEVAFRFNGGDAIAKVRAVSPLGWAFVGLSAVLVALVLFGSLSGNLSNSTGGSGDDPVPVGEERDYAAFSVCTDFVRDRLKAPATASFRNFFEDDGEVDVAGGPSQFTVRSSVDSENGFGANIRTEFTCEVSTSDGENFRLERLVM